ncbi:MAG: preprotein translocase subunit SecE [Rikenellaceae bacterium]|nr:preprotein translocase subunit SecE [Rikenellaceae bacterium]
MKRFIQYVKNAYIELVQKVSWPTWSQLQSSAIVVMISSLLFAIVILCMDLVFETLMATIYGLLY